MFGGWCSVVVCFCHRASICRVISYSIPDGVRLVIGLCGVSPPFACSVRPSVLAARPCVSSSRRYGFGHRCSPLPIAPVLLARLLRPFPGVVVAWCWPVSIACVLLCVVCLSRRGGVAISCPSGADSMSVSLSLPAYHGTGGGERFVLLDYPCGAGVLFLACFVLVYPFIVLVPMPSSYLFACFRFVPGSFCWLPVSCSSCLVAISRLSSLVSAFPVRYPIASLYSPRFIRHAGRGA